MYIGSNPLFTQVSTRIRRISGWLDQYQSVAAFIAAFLIFMVLHRVENISSFQWDARDYWSLSAVHELLNFPAVIRGYFYPLLLAPSRFVFDLYPDAGFTSYRIFSSAAYAYMLAVLLPGFYGTTFGGRITFWRRLVVPLLVAFIYPGLIVYPLSDLPAICLVLAAAVCATRSVTCDARRLQPYVWLFLAGIAAYGAYNTRTIFLFAVVALAIGVPLVLYRGHPWKSRVPVAVAFLVGIAIAGIPQAFINHNIGNGWTPAVVTSTDGTSLFARQLLWGMLVQKYETSTDPHSAPVIYPDTVGQQLAGSLKVTTDLSVKEYLSFLPQHPFDFAGIYGRHLINGLDVRDGEEYVTKPSPTRNGFAFFNFVTVFTGLSIMLAALIRHPPRETGNAVRLFWVFVALFPVLMIIPGAVETRFFLPLNLAIYSAIAFSADPRKLAHTLGKHWLVIIPAFCLSLSLFFAITLDTMSHVEHSRVKEFILLGSSP